MADSHEDRLKRLTAFDLFSARSQWKSIIDRRPVAQGQRQVDFLPVEVLLSLAAMLLVTHRRYGSSTAHLAPTPVPELSALFRRPPSSILAKMANLDGSRKNGGKAEIEAAALLLHHQAAELLAAYTVVLAAARAEGIGEDRLPDFLAATGLQGNGFVGQDDVSSLDIELAVADDAQALADGAGVAPAVTERLLVAVARVGQHVFASNVLSNCGQRCVFCGMAPGPELRGRGLLRASHIKPWRASDNKERLDHANGLAACPDHDVAFDGGLIFLTDDLEVRLTAQMKQRTEEDKRMKEVFGSPPLTKTLLLPTDATQPGSKYVRWHREHIAAA